MSIKKTIIEGSVKMISRKCPVCGTNEHVYVVDKGGGVCRGMYWQDCSHIFSFSFDWKSCPNYPKKTSADFYLCACAKCGHRFEVRD